MSSLSLLPSPSNFSMVVPILVGSDYSNSSPSIPSTLESPSSTEPESPPKASPQAPVPYPPPNANEREFEPLTPPPIPHPWQSAQPATVTPNSPPRSHAGSSSTPSRSPPSERVPSPVPAPPPPPPVLPKYYQPQPHPKIIDIPGFPNGLYSQSRPSTGRSDGMPSPQSSMYSSERGQSPSRADAGHGYPYVPPIAPVPCPALNCAPPWRRGGYAPIPGIRRALSLEESHSDFSHLPRTYSPPTRQPELCSQPIPYWPPRVVGSFPPQNSMRPTPCVVSPSIRSSLGPRERTPLPEPVSAPWSSFHQLLPHPRFYFPDGNLSLVLKNVQYKVHRHFLQQHSKVLCDAPPGLHYRMHLNDDTDREGFDLVLSIFYPKDCFGGHDIRTPADWGKVLRVACQYEMNRIREMALEKATEMSAIDKIELAVRFKLKHLLVPAFTELSMTSFYPQHALATDDAKKIGLEAVLVLQEVKREVMNELPKYLNDEKVGELVVRRLAKMELL